MQKNPSLALVTGATSGIGRALCVLLASQGIEIIATGRNLESLHQLKQELSSQVNVEVISVDLLQKEERQKVIEQIQRRAPDLVINNAGFGLYGDCLTYTTDEQLEILALNSNVLTEITLEAARVLVSQNKKGIIFNVSSAAAYQIIPTMAVYSASKAYVNQFSLALNEELKPQGISVLTICPGMVETGFQKRAGGKDQSNINLGAMTPEYVAQSIWDQIQKQKTIKIIDWKYRLMTYLSLFFPQSIVSSIIKKNIMSRIPPRAIIKTSYERRDQ